MKHINIALFVPHSGCPHRCSFCNQRTISGTVKKTCAEDVINAVENAIKSRDCSEGEIAFFGGSFTAVSREYMISLLESAYPYIKNGKVKGIRCSTRPDCIDDETLKILKKYGVTTIELGCQSMDDEVLLLNKRGHNSFCVYESVEKIKQFGFKIGLQMMTGLYSSNHEKDLMTAEILAGLKPDFVRVYPTIILENTENAQRYKNGEYIPESLAETIELCSRILLIFEEKNIPVIRLGLHSGGNVEEGYLAGPYHPALRELCESEICFNKMYDALSKSEKGYHTVEVGERYLSQFLGQKRINIERLEKLGYYVSFQRSKDLGKYQFTIV